jgi:hypothetical protein
MAEESQPYRRFRFFGTPDIGCMRILFLRSSAHERVLHQAGILIETFCH